MAFDWLPRTSRRPNPREVERRREKLYRDIGYAQILNLKLALICWPIIGAVFLLLHLLQSPEHRVEWLIALGVLLLPAAGWAFYVALRPQRPKP